MGVRGGEKGEEKEVNGRGKEKRGIGREEVMGKVRGEKLI